MDDPADSLTLEIVATLDDQVAFQMFLLARAPLARMRLRREAALIAFAPVALVSGMLFAWVLDPDRPRFAPFFHDVVFGQPVPTLRYVLGAFVVMGAVVLGRRLRTRARVRRMVRRVLLARTDVDRADPFLATTTLARFDEEGITSEVPTGRTLVRWGAISEAGETGALFYFISGFANGLFVPRQAISDDQAERLRALVARHRQSPPEAV